MLKDIKKIDDIITYISLYYPNAVILNINAYKNDAYSVTIKNNVFYMNMIVKSVYYEMQFKEIKGQIVFDDIYRLD